MQWVELIFTNFFRVLSRMQFVRRSQSSHAQWVNNVGKWEEQSSHDMRLS